MGIRYITGDLLESKADALINTVNCVGIMGKGIAKQFKDKYPENYKRYKSTCAAGEIRTGSLFITIDHPSNKTIINLPTKQDWRNPSEIEWIVQGLFALREFLQNMNMSVALPPLGCGNGGLDWETQVHPLIVDALGDLPVDIEVYAPKPIVTEIKGLRVLVTGGREYNIVSAVRTALATLSPVEIIHGLAKGADTLAGSYGKDIQIQVTEFPADWNQHGKAAGPIRNEKMLLESKPDIVLAFNGNSGTDHMKTTAHKHGYPVILSDDKGMLTFDTRIHNMRRTNNQCPPGFIRVDRATKWGNPTELAFDTPEERARVITLYEDHMRNMISSNTSTAVELANLAGKTLACWCHPNNCHADIIAYYANFYGMAALPTPAKLLGLE